MAGRREESDQHRARRRSMVDSLRGRDDALDDRVLGVMGDVPRHMFLPGALDGIAYDDRAFGIGFDQTISAPHMVAIMCSLLDLHPGHRVLEVGTGSGYHAAVMARLVQPGGQVVTVECIPDLARTARDRLDSARIEGVEVRVGDGAAGAEDEAPFDRISVAAAAPEVPAALVRQLAPAGRLVVPVGRRECDLVVLARTATGGLERSVHGRCVFVPLTGPHEA